MTLTILARGVITLVCSVRHMDTGGKSGKGE
jgi:hypothetical protein